MRKRINIYIIGMIITALGIALVVKSEVGSGPWDSVAVGLKNHLGLTIGMWSIIAQGCVVGITALVEKKRYQFESVLAIILRSWFLDLWFYIILDPIPFTISVPVQWITYLVGLAAVGIGIGIYVEARFPKTPMDGLMIALIERFGWSYSNSRLIIEFSGVAIGFLLGGPVGLGTLIMAFSLGKIISVTNNLMKHGDGSSSASEAVEPSTASSQ